ncbi:uncharacterized protein [Miscanthus floridulus]|uniref:uncharacterized protein n=1 Tax=Miscanthus floridulus TaxID=154761 RepID=UPI00345951BC
MDNKTSSSIANVPNPAADPYAHSAEAAAEKQSPARHALLALVCLLRVGVIALMASSIPRSAWRARGDPWELAFVAGPSALLAAIFVCLHRAERLTPESPHGERWRLQVAVWALSTAMSCVLAYRVSLAMPAALLVTVVWCMTSFVVVVGFYMLVPCKDRQYQRVEEVHDDADDDGKRKPRNKTRPADQLV